MTQGHSDPEPRDLAHGRPVRGVSVVRPLVALAILALAAGCMGSTVVPVLPQQVPGGAFLPPLVMKAADGSPAPGFEPSLTVDANGVVYLTAAQGVRASDPDASWLWVSRDAGATFENVAPVSARGVSNLPVGFEGHVDANGGQAYYVDLTLASITLSRTTDGGETWDLRTPAVAVVGGGDREWVAAGPKGDVYVAWNQLPSGFWVMGSQDGGRTFPAQTLIPGTGAVGGATPGWSYAGVPAVAPNGAVHVARAEPEGLAVYTSTDGARTFTRTVAWPAEGPVGWLFSTSTVDDAGTLYVSTVEDLESGTTRVRYAYSKDGGATFSPPREVTSAPGVHAMQWGAAGAPGHFALAFYENPAGQGVPDEAAGQWHVRVAWSTNADTPDASFHTTRATDRVVHEGTVCTGGLTQCEGTSRDLGDYLGVDLGRDGSVHVTWIETTAEGSPVMYARTAPR